MFCKTQIKTSNMYFLNLIIHFLPVLFNHILTFNNQRLSVRKADGLNLKCNKTTVGSTVLRFSGGPAWLSNPDLISKGVSSRLKRARLLEQVLSQVLCIHAYRMFKGCVKPDVEASLWVAP